MSDIIHLLPDRVANQIAAGEVIQRPASVIKELVENALDAGASAVNVLVVDAGRTSIQVVDDGKGMSATDARLAFERHATSKIRNAEDLFSLSTMGFRGEALASIAAVAQVELRTRQKTDEIGSLVTIEGSKVISQEPVAASVGSSFLVKNLFFNVPARRKFLKSNQTEMSNILAEFERIALVYPNVSFTLHHNGTVLFNLPVSSLRERVLRIFGKSINEKLLDMEVHTTLINIKGFVAKPESARKNGNHQYLFVNGRYMRHPYFHKAVMEAYEKLIPEGYQVSYFIYFSVDPAAIDVNIHPTKTEIKFESEQAIWQILLAAVREVLGKFSEVPTIDFDVEGRPNIPVFNPETSKGNERPLPNIDVNPSFNPFDNHSENATRPPSNWDSLYAVKHGTDKEHNLSLFTHNGEKNISSPELGPENVEVESVEQHAQSVEGDFADKTNIHYQYKGCYILTSVKSGLMIIDQHRAHTRILYDDYMHQFQQHRGTSQGLLFPEMFEVPQSEAVILESIWDDLHSIGFELANLGQGNFSINGVPAGTEGLNPATLVRSMIETAQNKGGDIKAEVQSLLALSLAKSAAIVSGQILSNEEMENIVDSLFACSMPRYTPDGKLVFYIFRQEEIERFF